MKIFYLSKLVILFYFFVKIKWRSQIQIFIIYIFFNREKERLWSLTKKMKVNYQNKNYKVKSNKCFKIILNIAKISYYKT